MTRLRISAAALLALAASALVVGSALASATSSVSGKYSGKVTEKVSGQNVSAAVKGSGSATLLGKGGISGTVAGTTANPPCTPLSGPGVISGTGGTMKITVASTSRACAAGEDDQDNISFNGKAAVKGGTGKFKKAKGTLTFSGHYNRASGAFTVKLSGSVKY